MDLLNPITRIALPPRTVATIMFCPGGWDLPALMWALSRVWLAAVAAGAPAAACA